jgi:nucleotide-binding universal stress UspA family protein
MSNFKRILVPVDGSEISNKALSTALQMARQSGGSVLLVHAFDELAYAMGYGYTPKQFEAAREALTKVLSDAKAIAESAGVAAQTKLIEQPAQRLGDVIATEAAAWDADLVVVGTHGRRGIGRALLGSGAEQIIRGASVPVLVIRGA